MKKRVLAVLLSASMVAGMFAGCGKSEEETVATTETTEETTESEELSEEEAWKLEPAYGETIIITGGAANCVSAVFVADELGFIEEEGLKVERTYRFYRSYERCCSWKS